MTYEPAGRNIAADWYGGLRRDALEAALDAGVTFAYLVAAAQAGAGAGAVAVYKLVVECLGLDSFEANGTPCTAADLAAGLTLFEGAIGDLVADAHLYTPTPYDVGAMLDLGPDDGAGFRGLFSWWDAARALTVSTPGQSRGIEYGQNDSLAASVLLNAGGSLPGYATAHRFYEAQPFKVVISVNGAKGGAPIESTVGRVDLYVVVHPAAAMTVPTITV